MCPAAVEPLNGQTGFEPGWALVVRTPAAWTSTYRHVTRLLSLLRLVMVLNAVS